MGFLGSLFGKSRNDKDAAPANPFFAEVVAELGDGIAGAKQFGEHLTAAYNVGASFFARQVAIIPGTLDLSRQNFARDPLVQTLFHTAEDVQFALGRSIETKETLPNLSRVGVPEAFALVGMRCRESDQIPGHPPVFADHSLKCLAASEDEVREALVHVALIRLLKTFGEHVEKLRRRTRLLRIEWNITNPHARGNNASGTEEYVYAETELQPDNLLRGLCAWLANPAEHLRIAPGGARVNLQRPDGTASVLELPVLHSADRRQWFVCIVRFPVAEGTEALSREARTHRYIYI